MKVSDLLESRRENWRELESLLAKMEVWLMPRLEAAAVARFSALYRAACADLALADAYQLPPETVQYLHRLVGRAHNQLYRSRTFNLAAWSRQLLVDVPQRLFADNALRLAFCVFWGLFLLSMMLARSLPGYAQQIAGEESLDHVVEMYSRPIGQYGGGDGLMAGFYIFLNIGIGLKCFAFGLLFGVGGLFVTMYNATLLGAIFGYMSTVPQRDNFYEFVTAHGPFELTAIVLSAAAGMRLGFALVDTHGLTRMDSLRRSATEAMPIMGAAMVMFALAAMIEGFLSPSPLPYWLKASTAVASTAMLLFYFVALGYPRGD